MFERRLTNSLRLSCPLPVIGQLELMWASSANHRSRQLRRRQLVCISQHIAQTTNVVFWFVNGLITNITRKIQAGQRMDTSSMTSRILRLHSFNYYCNIEHIPWGLLWMLVTAIAGRNFTNADFHTHVYKIKFCRLSCNILLLVLIISVSKCVSCHSNGSGSRLWELHIALRENWS